MVFQMILLKNKLLPPPFLSAVIWKVVEKLALADNSTQGHIYVHPFLYLKVGAHWLVRYIRTGVGKILGRSRSSR